jgi:serine/threonine protein kinase
MLGESDRCRWHGDVKPENILRVQERFKLADPGEARIFLAQTEDGQSRAPVTGGTRTYGKLENDKGGPHLTRIILAAPEKALYLDGTVTEPRTILQNSDVWSLGCVFSIAATYVVLGTQGVLQYDRVRRFAMDTEAEANIVKDAFHNGTHVLKAVTEWHEYLRSCIRLTDAYTDTVLKMIDDHMLVVPAEDRWNAGQVKEHLGEIIKHPPVNALIVPATIEAVLQQVDLAAEIETEMSVNDSGSRVDSERAKTILQKARPDTADHTQAVLFKSKDELLGLQILPTAQRSKYRATLVQKFAQTSNEDNRQESPERGEPVARVATNSTSQTAKPRPTMLTDAISLVGTKSEDGEQSDVSHKHPVTMWQVEAQLEKLGKGRSLGSLRSGNIRSAFRNQPTSVKGLIKDDPLKEHYGENTRRDIVS